MLAAQTAVLAPQPAHVPRVDTPPTIEALVAGEWAGAVVIRDIQQREPYDGEPVSEATTIHLVRDARALYVGFVCEDARRSELRAHLSRRDAILQDDQVVVLLDTFRDRQRAYLFAANPLGIQADAIAAEGKDDDYSFDTVWRSEGRITDAGFVVLMAIPFRSLRLPPAGEGTWGVAVGRILPRKSEQAYWPWLSRRIEGRMQQFAAVTGFAEATGGRNLQLIPYLAGDAGRFLDRRDAAYTSVGHARMGVDAKLVLRDAIAVDVAVNPDFSQIESDQPQVSINQRFELFFPEKRPFFLENAALFRYPAVPPTRTLTETMFFSRRIQDPVLGARVTGRAAAWTFGGILVRDRVPASAADDLSPLASIGVARLQREFRGQSTIGVFATSRTAPGDTSHVGAADLRWKVTPNLVLHGQAMASRSATTRETTGSAYHAAALYGGRSVFATLFYADRSPEFRAALGFVPRVDIRQIEHYGEYRRRPRRGPVVAWGPNSFVRLNWDHRGRLQEWIVRFPFQVDLKGRSAVFLRRVESYELFNGVNLRQHLQTITITTEWLSWLTINENVEWGDTPNYFPPPGVRPFVGRSLTASLGLTFRPTPRARVEQTVLFTTLRTRDHDQAASPAVVFSNTIERSTFNFQFTRNLSVRTIVDYRAVSPNPSLVQLTREKRAGIDVLFAYQVGPSTAVYAGYVSGFENIRIHPTFVTPTRTLQTEVGRQVTVKLSYLWRP